MSRQNRPRPRQTIPSGTAKVVIAGTAGVAGLIILAYAALGFGSGDEPQPTNSAATTRTPSAAVRTATPRSSTTVTPNPSGTQQPGTPLPGTTTPGAGGPGNLQAPASTGGSSSTPPAGSGNAAAPGSTSTSSQSQAAASTSTPGQGGQAASTATVAAASTSTAVPAATSTAAPDATSTPIPPTAVPTAPPANTPVPTATSVPPTATPQGAPATMALNPNSGSAGQPVTMTLHNFPPNTRITLCVSGILCGATSYYAGTTDANGDLVNDVSLPEGTPEGTWTMRASGGGKSATANFTVN